MVKLGLLVLERVCEGLPPPTGKMCTAAMLWPQLTTQPAEQPPTLLAQEYPSRCLFAALANDA